MRAALQTLWRFWAWFISVPEAPETGDTDLSYLDDDTNFW